jgi:hypothetical protein
VVIIGSGKDGLPVILGNVDTPASLPTARTPSENDTVNKQTTTAAAGSDTSSVATSGGPHSLWPLSLSDIEAYLSQILGTAPKQAEPR